MTDQDDGGTQSEQRATRTTTQMPPLDTRWNGDYRDTDLAVEYAMSIQRKARRRLDALGFPDRTGIDPPASHGADFEGLGNPKGTGSPADDEFRRIRGTTIYLIVTLVLVILAGSLAVAYLLRPGLPSFIPIVVLAVLGVLILGGLIFPLRSAFLERKAAQQFFRQAHEQGRSRRARERANRGFSEPAQGPQNPRHRDEDGDPET